MRYNRKTESVLITLYKEYTCSNDSTYNLHYTFWSFKIFQSRILYLIFIHYDGKVRNVPTEIQIVYNIEKNAISFLDFTADSRFGFNVILKVKGWTEAHFHLLQFFKYIFHLYFSFFFKNKVVFNFGLLISPNVSGPGASIALLSWHYLGLMYNDTLTLSWEFSAF